MLTMFGGGRGPLIHESMGYWIYIFEFQDLLHSAEWVEARAGEESFSWRDEVNRAETEVARENAETEASFVDSVAMQHLRSAFFIASIAGFEQALAGIASFEGDRRRAPIRAAELKHRGVRRYQFYLERVAGADFPSDTDEWQRVLRLAKLRNHLVHVGRSDHDLTSGIEAIVRGEPGLTLDEDLIYFRSGYVPEVIRLLDSVLCELACRNVVEPATLGEAASRRIGPAR